MRSPAWSAEYCSSRDIEAANPATIDPESWDYRAMDETMTETVQTAPFAPFEWMLSARYLRARRKEGFISVIAGFSFLGIMLGVATLIIVMAVMNGFRKELLDKILGLNGHILVQPLESPLTDWKDVADRLSQVEGIRLAAPVVDGQALASSPWNASGVLVRGIRSDDLNNLTSIAKNIKQGSLEGFDEGQGVAIGRRLADQLSLHAGDSITLVAPRGAVSVVVSGELAWGCARWCVQRMKKSWNSRSGVKW